MCVFKKKMILSDNGESYFDEGLPCVISRQGFQAATASDTIKPQQINLSRGTLPNLNFHGRGPRSKIIRISRSEFANFASWRHRTFGDSVILPHKVSNVTDEEYSYLNLRNRDL